MHFFRFFEGLMGGLFMNSIYEQIKDRLTMNAVARRCGFEVNRAGFMSCPFHHENTASCKLYKNSFYCFGCGEGGDIIKFVSKLYGIGNFQAALRINDDFGLGITARKPNRSEYSEFLKKQAEEKRKLEKYRAEYRKKSDEVKMLRSLPKPKTEDEGGRYAKYLARLDYLENCWFVENHWR